MKTKMLFLIMAMLALSLTFLVPVFAAPIQQAQQQGQFTALTNDVVATSPPTATKMIAVPVVVSFESKMIVAKQNISPHILVAILKTPTMIVFSGSQVDAVSPPTAQFSQISSVMMRIPTEVAGAIKSYIAEQAGQFSPAITGATSPPVQSGYFSSISTIVMMRQNMVVDSPPTFTRSAVTKLPHADIAGLKVEAIHLTRTVMTSGFAIAA